MANRNKFDPDLIPDRPHLDFERALWEQGLKYIGGVDEAGRGALAGPVYAAVAILPVDFSLTETLLGVRDSKQMTPCARDYWADRLKHVLSAYGVGWAANTEIDELGIVPAVRLAVQRAIGRLCLPPQHLLVDFMHLPNSPLPQTPLIKGDSRSLSIASASILAKTCRDRYMEALDQLYPGYGFAENKGYGTLFHRDAIQRLGRCPEHRVSFHFHEAEKSQETKTSPVYRKYRPQSS